MLESFHAGAESRKCKEKERGQSFYPVPRHGGLLFLSPCGTLRPIGNLRKDIPMVPQWIIEKKRDGKVLEADEIRDFIQGYTAGRIPDYQMAAMAMAIYFKGMTPAEIAALTDTMLHSGDVIDTSAISLPKVDKHSTGGIGDKVSIILAPLAAAAGVAVPMISGRGLGITGGTLDKLASIPGFRTDLSEKRFIEIIQACGFSMMGQTGDVAPADKKLYALRDVTATVPSIPLITASIMCKKLAEGIDSLVLDVKWGTGAFMKSVAAARELAESMVRVGEAMGKNITAFITGMNQPLGQAVGNSLEIIESMECLQGQHLDGDLMQVTLRLTAEIFVYGQAVFLQIVALVGLERQRDGLTAAGDVLIRRQRAVLVQGQPAVRIHDVGGDGLGQTELRFHDGILIRHVEAPALGVDILD